MIHYRAFRLFLEHGDEIRGSATRFLERDRIRREVNEALEILTMESLA